ncbi:MAG: low molecular weight phosphatase family protein [Terracidiphilus sp.]
MNLKALRHVLEGLRIRERNDLMLGRAHAILCLRRDVIIHFVCTGNIYRSRLAEAYCASKCVPGIQTLSSGIGAGLNGDAPISPFTADVLTRYGLVSYAAEHWQRTTAALVEVCDVLVFMELEHHRFCENWIDPNRQRIEVWGIEDVGPLPASEIPGKAERTFQIIRQRVDALLAALAAS